MLAYLLSRAVQVRSPSDPLCSGPQMCDESSRWIAGRVPRVRVTSRRSGQAHKYSSGIAIRKAEAGRPGYASPSGGDHLGNLHGLWGGSRIADSEGGWGARSRPWELWISIGCSRGFLQAHGKRRVSRVGSARGIRPSNDVVRATGCVRRAGVPWSRGSLLRPPSEPLGIASAGSLGRILKS